VTPQDRDYRFEVTGITPIGVEVRFLRATAVFAVEKAQELVSLGSRKVVITDLLNGTHYAPGKFEGSWGTSAGTSPANPCCFCMTRNSRVRGDINARLNGLIREGVITAFETNFDWVTSLGVMHIAVAASVVTDPRRPGYEREKAMAIRNRVTKELESVGARDIVVSVRSS
jgi:hypothetical protein